MNSKNNLTITGKVTDFKDEINVAYARFLLVHNYGGGSKPLFLSCKISKTILEKSPDKIRDSIDLYIDAALKPQNNRIVANVKSFRINC